MDATREGIKVLIAGSLLKIHFIKHLVKHNSPCFSSATHSYTHMEMLSTGTGLIVQVIIAFENVCSLRGSYSEIYDLLVFMKFSYPSFTC